MTAVPRTPPFRLEGKRALVTGAGRGLGLAAAAALAEAGAEVILAARTEERDRGGARCDRSGGRQGRGSLRSTSPISRPIAGAGVAPMPSLTFWSTTPEPIGPAPFLEVTAADFDAVMAI